MIFSLYRTGLTGITVCLSMIFSLEVASSEDVVDGSSDAGISYYGYLNQGIMQYDDGVETINYGRVDNAVNDNVNRFGIVYDRPLSSGWKMQGTLEIGIAPKPSDQVSQTDSNNSDWRFDKHSLRKFEVSFSNDRLGAFYIGQGDMSGRGSGPDYSGTGIITSSNPAQIAGGNYWRASNGGGLTTRQLNDSFSNFDTGRRFRIRYDSRSYGDFRFSTSLGREILSRRDDKTYFDLVGTYTKDMRHISLTTELGVNGLGNSDFAGRAGFSLIHHLSGLNVTALAAHSTSGPHYGYFKIGLIRDLFAIGSTAVSIDLYNGGEFVVTASESLSRGISIVQRIEKHDLEIFATVRTFEGYNNKGLANEEFLTSKAIVAGLNWEF